MQKVLLTHGIDKAVRENVKERFNRLSLNGKKALKKVLSYGKVEFRKEEYDPVLIAALGSGKDVGTVRGELERLKFVTSHFHVGVHNRGWLTYSVEEEYRAILQELLLSD